MLKSTLENSWSSVSQKTLQTDVIYVFLLEDPWEQVFSPNSLDWTTFQGFRIEPLVQMLNTSFLLPVCTEFYQENAFPGKQQDSVWYSAGWFSSFKECGFNNTDIENTFIFLPFVSVLVSLCSHTEQTSRKGKDYSFFLLFFFFPISCENIGNESLFVGKNWNILAELSRDTVMGEHRTELRGVSGTVCEISQREGAAGQEKKKTCLGKAVVEKFMAYIGWLDQEHKRSQKIRNTKIIFFL